MEKCRYRGTRSTSFVVLACDRILEGNDQSKPVILYVIPFNNYNLNYIIIRPYAYGALGYVDVISRYF